MPKEDGRMVFFLLALWMSLALLGAETGHLVLDVEGDSVEFQS